MKPGAPALSARVGDPCKRRPDHLRRAKRKSPQATPLWTLSAIVLLDSLGVGLLLPVLPYFVLDLGAPAAVVTQLVALYWIMSLVAAPSLGRLADRYGRRPVLLATLTAGALSPLGMLLAHNLLLVFVFRAVGGVSSANDAIAQAMATDNLQKDAHLRRLASLGAVRSVGMILGPVVGGLVALVWTDPAQYYRATLGAAAVAAAAVLILAAVVLPRSLPAQRAAPTEPSSRRVPGALLWGLPLLVALLASSYAMGVVSSVTALYLNHVFGWRPREVGWTLGVVVSGSIAARFVLSRTGQGASARRGWLMASLGVAACALYLVTLVDRPLEVWALLFIFSTGCTVAVMLVTAYVAEHAPAKARGLCLGVAQGLTSAGFVVGPALSGPLFQFVGPEAPYRVAAAACMLGALAICALRHLPKDVPLAAPG